MKGKLSVNSSGEIIYDNDIILDVAAGRRDLIEHNVESYSNTYTLKFSEIILETQVHLRKRFQDFEELPLKHLCQLFDFKLWPKSFTSDKKWGFDVLADALKYYVQYNFITDKEAEKCKRQ